MNSSGDPGGHALGMNAVRRRAVLLSTALLLGGLVAWAAWAWQRHDNAVRAQQRFDVLAQRVTDDVATRMKAFRYGLRGAWVRSWP